MFFLLSNQPALFSPLIPPCVDCGWCSSHVSSCGCAADSVSSSSWRASHLEPVTKREVSSANVAQKHSVPLIPRSFISSKAKQLKCSISLEENRKFKKHFFFCKKTRLFPGTVTSVCFVFLFLDDVHNTATASRNAALHLCSFRVCSGPYWSCLFQFPGKGWIGFCKLDTHTDRLKRLKPINVYLVTIQKVCWETLCLDIHVDATLTMPPVPGTTGHPQRSPVHVLFFYIILDHYYYIRAAQWCRG